MLTSSLGQPTIRLRRYGWETSTEGSLRRKTKKKNKVEEIQQANLARTSQAKTVTSSNTTCIDTFWRARFHKTENGSLTPQDNDVVRFRRLEAEKASIRQLEYMEKICTTNGDIGYHVKLKNSEGDEPMEEGDLVGFFADDNQATSDTRIERLTDVNASKAHLAGVITRSAYLQARTPGKHEDVETDVVCVMGIVKVKVLGTIRHGELIYASSLKPGVALPRGYMQLLRKPNQPPILLGQSLETKHAENPNDTILVECFVSVVFGGVTHQIFREIEEANTDQRTYARNTAKKEIKSFRRGAYLKMGLLSIFILLACICIWQLCTRSTCFQYWLCRQGMKKHQARRRACVSYKKDTIEGFEFEWSKLQKKLHLHASEISGETDVQYFLNVHRCAYLKLWWHNTSEDRGLPITVPEVFAVAQKEEKLYFLTGKTSWDPVSCNKTKGCFTLCDW